MTNSSLLKDNDEAGLAGRASGAAADCWAIKPLRCTVATALACTVQRSRASLCVDESITKPALLLTSLLHGQLSPRRQAGHTQDDF